MNEWWLLSSDTSGACLSVVSKHHLALCLQASKTYEYPLWYHKVLIGRLLKSGASAAMKCWTFHIFAVCADRMEMQIICWKAMMNESCGRRLLTWGSCWTATSSNWASSDRGSMSFLPSRSCVTHTNINTQLKHNNDNNKAIKIPP